MPIVITLASVRIMRFLASLASICSVISCVLALINWKRNKPQPVEIVN